MFLRSVTVLTTVLLCHAYFDCVCNLNSRIPVYVKTSVSGTPMGYLDFRDCKQRLQDHASSNWTPIAFKHKIGYVENASGVNLQICQGFPPVGDVVIIPVAATTTLASTTGQSTPTVNSNPRTTARSGVIQNTSATTMMNPMSTLVTSTAAQTSSNSNAPTSTLVQTTTGSPPSSTTTNGNSDGDIGKCPYSMTQAAGQYNAAVGQFQHKCYAVGRGHPLAWYHAESFCSQFYGHLVHIENPAEQSFVTDFVRRHSYGRSVWLGYNDRSQEGHYTWTYGGVSSYTNWAPGHPSRFGHEYDDCVKLDPSRNGQWFDARCGRQWFFYDAGETHEVMCQLDLLRAPAIIG